LLGFRHETSKIKAENVLDNCSHLVCGRIYDGPTRLDNGLYGSDGQMKLSAALQGGILGLPPKNKFCHSESAFGGRRIPHTIVEFAAN
jgi:hypothetical protein